MDDTTTAMASLPVAPTPQVQRASSSLAQVFESMTKSDVTDQRIKSLETLVRNLAAEQARTQASLTSTQEILAATQQELASCRSSNRELQQTVGKCSGHILSQEPTIVKLKQENANIVHHINSISHNIAQFETRVAGAHHQLNEKLMHTLAQDGKIDNFQNRLCITSSPARNTSDDFPEQGSYAVACVDAAGGGSPAPSLCTVSTCYHIYSHPSTALDKSGLSIATTSTFSHQYFGASWHRRFESL
ncbi:hypothetical protein NDA16_000118 [Ustilago loliicola]|nr:hypothetical protein NDA16_000118 [Ustilago loliicola]